jgi:small subunit ribosomal protein S5
MARRRGRGRGRGKGSGLLEEVITIRFHTKVTKGGRNLSVGVLVAVGNGKGKVGLGYGKARGVPAAIEKAAKDAQGQMVTIHTIGDTIGHEVRGRHGSASVLLMPASPGTGVKAGSTVRSILQVAGVHNVLTKVYGPTNPINVAKATMKALESIRSKSEVEKLRGVEIEINHPQVKTRKPDAEKAEQAEQADAAQASAPEAAAEQAPAQEQGEDSAEETSEQTAEEKVEEAAEKADEAETVEVAAEAEETPAESTDEDEDTDEE